MKYGRALRMFLLENLTGSNVRVTGNPAGVSGKSSKIKSKMDIKEDTWGHEKGWEFSIRGEAQKTARGILKMEWVEEGWSGSLGLGDANYYTGNG